MEREQFFTILKRLYIECDKVNKKDPESEIIYEVLQFSDLAKKADIVREVAEFYDENWTGNRDFMHIPNFYQTLTNCLNYPVIVAREKGKKEILGISTIKYDENKDEVDPYFPEEDAKYFSITGILIKKGTTHKGMGKKIEEIAIRGAHEYSKIYPDTRMMGVIDCRNEHSLKALASAAQSIADSGDIGEGIGLPVYITGYYELRDKAGENLLEAPTIVVEINLKGEEFKTTETSSISYSSNYEGELFHSLQRTLRESLKKYGLKNPIVMEDKDAGIVYYYPLEERCRLDGMRIKANGTELR